METAIAIELAGGRDKLAALLGVATITTYHWIGMLPAKHETLLRAKRPRWFREIERLRAEQAAETAANAES